MYRATRLRNRGALAGAGDLALLQAAMTKLPPVRVRGMLASTEMDTWERMGLKPSFGDDRFRVDGIKAWSDVSLQAGTGYLRAPYLGGTNRGALNYTSEALTEYDSPRAQAGLAGRRALKRRRRDRNDIASISDRAARNTTGGPSSPDRALHHNAPGTHRQDG